MTSPFRDRLPTPVENSPFDSMLLRIRHGGMRRRSRTSCPAIPSLNAPFAEDGAFADGLEKWGQPAGGGVVKSATP